MHRHTCLSLALLILLLGAGLDQQPGAPSSNHLPDLRYWMAGWQFYRCYWPTDLEQTPPSITNTDSFGLKPSISEKASLYISGLEVLLNRTYATLIMLCHRSVSLTVYGFVFHPSTLRVPDVDRKRLVLSVYWKAMRVERRCRGGLRSCSVRAMGERPRVRVPCADLKLNYWIVITEFYFEYCMQWINQLDSYIYIIPKWMLEGLTGFSRPICGPKEFLIWIIHWLFTRRIKRGQLILKKPNLRLD